jgi:beta-glucosidase
MPGPSVWRGSHLQHALTAGKVSRHTLDKRAKEVLDLVDWCAASGVPENAAESTRDTPETSAFLRKVAADAIVLMKNEGNVLPLKTDKKVPSQTK